MPLADQVNVTITRQTATPTRENFGTILLAGHHNYWANGDRVRQYSSLTAMVSDGFATTHPLYVAAAAVFAQSPNPGKVKIGRLSAAPAPTYTLEVTSATEGHVYRVKVNGNAEVSYTVPASATLTSVATAIAALIDALSGVDASSSAAVITVTPSTSGARVRFRDWTSNFLFSDNTPDHSLAAELTAINAADGDWYGLDIDTHSEACLNAAAAWAQSNRKLAAFTTSDSRVYDSAVTTDVGSDFKAANYDRASLFFNGNDTFGSNGAGALSLHFTTVPGSATVKFKTLRSVASDRLAETQWLALKNKNVNVFTKVQGVAMLEEGVLGGGEFIDVVRFIDWQTSEVQLSVYQLLLNNNKIPFTDAGIAVVKSTILAALVRGVNAGGLVDGTVAVNVPSAASVSELDKGARSLPDVTFEAQLAGAIHKVTILGTVYL